MTYISRARWLDDTEWLEGRIKRWSPWQKPPRGTLLNKSHPLARGLVGAWIMNEGTGNKINDLSGNGYHGQLLGIMSWGVGERGIETVFTDTGNEYIFVSNNYPLIPEAFSITVLTKFTNNDFNTIVGLGTNVPLFDMPRLGGNKQPFLYMNSTNNRYWNAFPSSYYGQYHACTVTLPSSAQNAVLSAACYLDGKLQGVTSTDTSGVQAARGKLWIGKCTSYYKGEMVFLYIHDRVLSAAEISQLHREPYGMFL